MRNFIQLFIAAIAGLVLATTIAACSDITADIPQQTADIPQQTTVISVNLTNAAGTGDAVGTVTLEDTEYGLLVTPDLSNLSAGLHGFHVHENPDCGPGEKEGRTVPGLAAGGHFDPDSTGNHEGPYAAGHLGDLPPLYVNEAGIANVPVLAPRLTVTDIAQRSLMIHAEGDNFSDEPAPLGGGGARLACGVI